MKKVFLKKAKQILLFLSAKVLFVQTVIILSIVYFLILGPVSILAKFASKDFLRTKPQSKTFWQKRKLFPVSLERAQKQY